MARSLTATVVFVLPLVLAGCIGAGQPPTDEAQVDQSTAGELAWARPLPQPVTQLVEAGRASDVETGKVLVTHGNHVYLAAQSAGLYILDISTPERPTLAGHEPDATGRDVDLIHYDDGRMVAVVGDSGQGMRFVDVTDPSEPEHLAVVLDGVANVHNVATVPGTALVYNSRSVDTPGVDIVDATDPADPLLVGLVRPELTCHDITFHAPSDRAYCAGVRETQIWDISDPLDPQVVGRVVNPSITVHHWALPVQDASILVIGDEFLGATGPHAQGCVAGTEDPLGPGTRTSPLGAIWFYDISDGTNPTPLGYVGADAFPELGVPPDPCTAHFGHPVGDQPVLVVGFIRGGVYLVDYEDPTSPALLDHVPYDGETWEVRVHGGYAWVSNTDRGLDVLTFEPG